MELNQTRRQPMVFDAISVSTHKVLRNTYFLLSLTLLFSALTATASVLMNAVYPGVFISLIGMFGLLFLTQALRNSAWGLLAIFAFTGFTGYILGPTIGFFIHHFANGAQLVFTALAGTGAIFLGLSGYVLVTKKDFTFLGGMLFVALLVTVLASLGAMLFHMPILQLIVTAATILIASGLILFDTSRIIQNGETNYIMATIALYLDIYMLFVNLLSLLGMTSSRE